MKPTFARRYLTSSPSPKSTRLEPSTSIRPAVGRSIPPMRFSRVVFPQPDGPWTATSSPSATCMSRPRSAITSDFPVRYTLIKSFVRMFGTSPTSELQNPRDVHARDANRDRERRQEHRDVRDAPGAGGGDDDHNPHLQLDKSKDRPERGFRAEPLTLLGVSLDVGASKGAAPRLRGMPTRVGREGGKVSAPAVARDWP